MSTLADRRGATFADVLVFLATLALGAALLYPAWSARAFRGRVDGAVAGIEAVRTEARRVLGASGRWPDPAAPGEASAELPSLAATGDGYRIGWTSWNVVDSLEVALLPPTPDDDAPGSIVPALEPVARSIGGVTVRSDDPALLAELAQRYVGEPNFVLDSMWLLILPERASAPIAER